MRRRHSSDLRTTQAPSRGSTYLVLSLFLALALFAVSTPRTRVLASDVSPSAMVPPGVLVGLMRVSSVTLSCDGSWSLAGSEPDAIDIGPGEKLILRSSGGGISWQIAGTSRKGTEQGNVLVRVALPSDGPFIVTRSCEGACGAFSDKSFRGSIIAMPESGAVLVANAVDMEEYIQSVVGGEVPDAWPMKVNEAQAIAARSYAAYRTGLAREFLDRDYETDFRSLSPGDVRVWASDQVYYGICEETPVTVTAAKNTRGQVLTYQGSPIAAYYHSDAGGMTEDPCYVWGGSIPYLPAVREEPHESPHSSWSVELSLQEICTATRLLALDLRGEPEAIYGLEGGESGRWFKVSVRSATDSVPVRGTDLRRVLPEVKSTLFSSYILGGGKATVGSLSSGMSYSVSSSNGVRGDARLGDAFAVGGTGDAVQCTRGTIVVSGLTADRPSEVILQGMGWGHGVGLSQWGALGMALSGSDARAILMLYYPDTILEQWW